MTKTQVRAAVQVVNHTAFALVQAVAAQMEERMGSYSVGPIVNYVRNFIRANKLPSKRPDGSRMVLEEVKIVTRPEGHIISVFYNHSSKLLVVDVVHKAENGGNEVMRKTLNFKRLLKHAEKAGGPA